jgi:hypothetical protein
MQIACENTVAFDSRKSRTVVGRPERHLNGPISLGGVPTLMRYHPNGRTRVYYERIIVTRRCSPLASRDLRCDREIIIDGRAFGRNSLLINNSAQYARLQFKRGLANGGLPV